MGFGRIGKQPAGAERPRSRQTDNPLGGRSASGVAGPLVWYVLGNSGESSSGRREEIMANRLAQETSPYLLQHKDNPVDRYPWGEEALGKARGEDRPTLLRGGY